MTSTESPGRQAAGAAPGAAYASHLEVMMQRWEAALEHSGFDAAVIGAGRETVRYRDDTTYPYRPDPFFVQWIPLLAHPGSRILVAPAEKPTLLLCRPDDFWHQPPAPPGPGLARAFNVAVFEDAAQLDAELQRRPGRLAWIGEPSQWFCKPPPDDTNPEALLTYLDYHRAVKTAWEIDNIRGANALAAAGHRAAADSFSGGGSEFDALLAFLAAGGQTQSELPYPAIIAMNEHAAVLHYQHYGRERNRGQSLLIDAGCSVNGYASDVSRTHAASDPEFTALIDAMHRLQQAMVARVRPGISFGDLHREAHQAIGKLLDDAGLISGGARSLVDDGVTALFFPHGLGHYLGLQVHDVGGNIVDADGSPAEAPADFPHLRLARRLEAGQVLTIEPGLYFIGSLLDRLRAHPRGRNADWPRIDRLRRFGGIRIEDDVLVTESGSQNLTRPAFEALNE